MKKLKLHEFSKRALEAREMNNLIGGSDEMVWLSWPVINK